MFSGLITVTHGLESQCFSTRLHALRIPVTGSSIHLYLEDLIQWAAMQRACALCLQKYSITVRKHFTGKHVLVWTCKENALSTYHGHVFPHRLLLFPTQRALLHFEASGYYNKEKPVTTHQLFGQGMDGPREVARWSLQYYSFDLPIIPIIICTNT